MASSLRTRSLGKSANPVSQIVIIIGRRRLLGTRVVTVAVRRVEAIETNSALIIVAAVDGEAVGREIALAVAGLIKNRTSSHLHRGSVTRCS